MQGRYFILAPRQVGPGKKEVAMVAIRLTNLGLGPTLISSVTNSTTALFNRLVDLFSSLRFSPQFSNTNLTLSDAAVPKFKGCGLCTGS